MHRESETLLKIVGHLLFIVNYTSLVFIISIYMKQNQIFFSNIPLSDSLSNAPVTISECLSSLHIMWKHPSARTEWCWISFWSRSISQWLSARDGWNHEDQETVKRCLPFSFIPEWFRYFNIISFVFLSSSMFFFSDNSLLDIWSSLFLVWTWKIKYTTLNWQHISQEHHYPQLHSCVRL